MSALAVPPTVPYARGGTVTDDILETVIGLADAAAEGTDLTDEGAALILMTAGPALRELLQRRRTAEVIADLVNPDCNVVLLRSAG